MDKKRYKARDYLDEEEFTGYLVKVNKSYYLTESEMRVIQDECYGNSYVGYNAYDLNHINPETLEEIKDK